MSGDEHSDVWQRGYTDAVQDRCENCAFASIGGPDGRSDPVVPKYIGSTERDDYLEGYVAACAKMFGEDWRTCELGWSLALTISGHPRRFWLKRGGVVVAEGVAFTDDAAVVRWHGERASTVCWASIDDALAVHGHPGTEIDWIDS